jgi:hypothetical protein
VVEDDPHIQLSAEDRAARGAAIEQLYAMEKTAAKDRKTIQGLKDALNVVRGQWKADAGKPDLPKIPEDIQKSADELQKKVDKVAEKYIRVREGLGNAGPPFEWKPDPLPDQVHCSRARRTTKRETRGTRPAGQRGFSTSQENNGGGPGGAE